VTVVVSDTSPLNYLVLCRAIEILPRLFQRVVVAPTVLKELRSGDAPAAVRAWAEELPPWVEVQRPAQDDPSLKLHSGERDAICLAMGIHADLVLIDDRAARKAARERGLTVVGTLGLLERAAAMNLLDLAAATDGLGRTTFKIAPALIKHALERDAQRRAERTLGDKPRADE
jgi:predicted nucleic acid-binding protein